MADGNRAAVHIDTFGVYIQSLIHRTGLCGECFVQFKQIHISGFPAGALQRLARRRHRAHAHGRRIQAGSGKRSNAPQRRQPQRIGARCTHHHNCGSAVVDAGGIAGSHAAGLVKRRSQTGQGFGAGFQVNELVLRKHHGLAFFLRQQHRSYFLLKLTGGLSRSGFLLRRQCQRILHIPGDTVFFGHVFSRDAHVVLVVNVPQAVDDHAVDHFPVAHALTIARVIQNVRRGTHVFLPACNDDVAVPVSHGLRRQHDCFQA